MKQLFHVVNFKIKIHTKIDLVEKIQVYTVFRLNAHNLNLPKHNLKK